MSVAIRKSNETTLRVVAIAAMVFIRIYLVAGNDIKISPDSSRYRFDSEPLKVFDFISGQGPGQLLQVINLLPLHIAIVIQAGIAALLWGLTSHVATKDLKFRYFLIMFAFCWSPWWLAFDWRVLTEAISISGMALFGAGVAMFLKGEPARWMYLGGTVVLLTRPLLVPVVAVMYLAVLFSRKIGIKDLAAITFITLILFSGIQTVAYNRALTDYSYLPQPSTMTYIQASDRFGARSSIDGYLALAKKKGLPACQDVNQIEYAWNGINKLRNSTCPGLQEWLNKGGLNWIDEIRYLPVSVIGVVFNGPWLRTTSWAYAPRDWGVFSTLSYGNENSRFRNVVYPDGFNFLVTSERRQESSL